MEEKNNQNPSILTVERNSKTDREKTMAILSYAGPLVIIPYLTTKDNPLVRFHIKQGLVLLMIEIALWLFAYIFPWLGKIWYILNLGTVVLSILGIINVIQNRQKEIPLVGNYAKYFKI